MNRELKNKKYSLYIVTVDTEDGRFEYEYGSLEHAKERLDQENQGFLQGYESGVYYLIEHKKSSVNYIGKTLSLTQDSHKKLTVDIKAEELYHELRTYFKWRKNSGDINSTITRFKRLGTSYYDNFIDQLKTLGY